MNPDDPNFDIQPNYIWAFWYDGQYAVPGWMISTQGYFNLDNVNGKNVITSIKDQPWIQPGDVLLNAVPLYLASTAKKENGKVIVHMKNGNRIEVK
jgi:hypothetical protein